MMPPGLKQHLYNEMSGPKDTSSIRHQYGMSAPPYFRTIPPEYRDEAIAWMESCT